MENGSMLKLRPVVLATILSAGAIGTIAVAATPAETISARHANFKQLGRATKAILDELRKPEPSLATINTNAQALNQAAAKIPGFFPPGTGPESGVKTEALPAIWQKNADFQAAAQKLVSAGNDLQRAAASNNLAAVKTAFPAVGGSCKGCHDNFRAKD
jgi:cytochrome c556